MVKKKTGPLQVPFLGFSQSLWAIRPPFVDLRPTGSDGPQSRR